ncbi:MAG: molybdopterin-binding protein, partial [Myxococcaceae bacterium]
MLCTGDELLTGLTADTNSPYFMERLLLLGQQVSHEQIVGDVMDDLVR